MVAAITGKQAALMVPTKSWRNNICWRLKKIDSRIPLKAVLLTGNRCSERSKKRVTPAQIESGKANLIIRTRALFQQTWTLRSWPLSWLTSSLSLREQQRALAGKGAGVNVLQMTATPISRKAITALESVVYAVKIPTRGRQPIKTSWVASKEIETGAFVSIKFEGDKRIMICPDWKSGFISCAKHRRFIMISAFLRPRESGAVKENAGWKKRSGDGGQQTTSTRFNNGYRSWGLDVPNAAVMVICGCGPIQVS